MGPDPPQKQKNELLEAIRDTRAAAEERKAQGQTIVQQCHKVAQTADLAEEATENIPDDSSQQPEEWARWRATWRDTGERLRSPSDSDVSIEYTAGNTTSSTSDVILAASLNQLLPAENRTRHEDIATRFHELAQVTIWDEEIEGHFVRLGLDRTRRDARSALDHFRAAKDALCKPSSIDPDPTAVLIALRGCIERALADLKQRCPCQERTRKASDKVTFILTQIGKPGVDAGQIRHLGAEVEKLRDELSSAKDKDLNSTQVRTLFAGTEAFIKTLLSLLHHERLSPA